MKTIARLLVPAGTFVQWSSGICENDCVVSQVESLGSNMPSAIVVLASENAPPEPPSPVVPVVPLLVEADPPVELEVVRPPSPVAPASPELVVPLVPAEPPSLEPEFPPVVVEPLPVVAEPLPVVEVLPLEDEPLPDEVVLLPDEVTPFPDDVVPPPVVPPALPPVVVVEVFWGLEVWSVELSELQAPSTETRLPTESTRKIDRRCMPSPFPAGSSRAEAHPTCIPVSWRRRFLPKRFSIGARWADDATHASRKVTNHEMRFSAHAN
jgi:hypothetical protein